MNVKELLKSCQADKTAVLSVIDLYNKYFAEGTIALEPSWFK